MTKEELQDYLIDEVKYPEDQVLQMTNFELVSRWLTWNGIIGYTEDIIEVIEAAYNVKLKE